MSIAIIGGGLAGASAAAELREGGYDGPITIFAAEPHLPYDRPPLSKEVLLGKKQPDSVYLHDADWYAEHNIEVLTADPVTSIDLDGHQVHTANGSTPYTQLVLATGSEPRRLPVADGLDIPVAYLRTVEDNARLLAAFAEKPHVAIIGAGWIGLEVAAAAHEAGCEVTVFESANLPLVGVLGPEVAQVFADLHRSHGVDLRLNAEVTAQDLAGFELVVVGIGAAPRTTLADEAGLDVDNGVLVDAQLRSSHPDVFAVGDIANQQHPVLGRRIRVEHWDNAKEQGKAVAHNLVGANADYDRQPYFFTDQYDLGMEYVGNVGPDGYDDVAIEGDTAGAFRAYWLKGGIVVAAMHANDWDASDAIRDAVGKPR